MTTPKLPWRPGGGIGGPLPEGIRVHDRWLVQFANGVIVEGEWIYNQGGALDGVFVRGTYHLWGEVIQGMPTQELSAFASLPTEGESDGK